MTSNLREIKQELAVREESALVEVPAIPESLAMAGLEEVDRSDLILPRVRVIQPTSKLEGNPGQLHYNLTGEAVDAIHAVLLKMTKSRVCWDKDNLGADPLCASDDAKTPRSQYADIYSDACASCPMAQWGVESDPSTPPACRLVFNFLAADLDHDDAIFVIGLGATSVKHAKKILSVFTLKRKPLFSQPVMVQAVKAESDKGKWYEVVITPNGGSRQFDWRPYAAMYQAYQAVTVEADIESTLDTSANIPDVDEIPF